MRMLTGELTRETFLSDDPEKVRTALEAYRAGHEYFHNQRQHAEKKMVELLMNLDFSQMLDMKMSMMLLDEVHVGIEYFELVILDHLRHLEEPDSEGIDLAQAAETVDDDGLLHVVLSRFRNNEQFAERLRKVLGGVQEL